MPRERLTDELLKRLLASATPDDYLAHEETLDLALSTYVTELLAERKLKKNDVIRATGLNGTQVYDIFAGKSKPGRDRAIMLAFGLRCALSEAQRLLRLAGVSLLWPKNRRDAIIIWCIEHGCTRTECDDELWRLHERALFGTGSLK